MIKRGEFYGENAFEIAQSAVQRVPFVFNSPHSGRNYPKSLRNASRLSDHALRQSEDVMVDELFLPVVEIGAPLLSAKFPRAWLDVNREPFELDPKLFAETVPPHANSRSIRVAGGLGTIPRIVAENQEIYAVAPTLEEALDRIETVYRPYHAALRRLIAKTAATFGHAVLVDCHSMPSSTAGRKNDIRADIIIGDRYGTSCDGAISRRLIESFSACGYRVARNKPYAGGFITEHYGRPLKGLHAVQIEINRALYMNEKTLELHEGFLKLQTDIRSVANKLVSLPDSGLAAISEAAE